MPSQVTVMVVPAENFRPDPLQYAPSCCKELTVLQVYIGKNGNDVGEWNC